MAQFAAISGRNGVLEFTSKGHYFRVFPQLLEPSEIARRSACYDLEIAATTIPFAVVLCISN